MSVRMYLITGLTLLISATATMGQTTKPAFGGEFTFRKIAPPSKDTKKRITIQIAPDANPFPKRPDPEIRTPQATPSDHADWFWGTISPDRTASGPGRFTEAVDFLAAAEQTKAISPRLNDLQAVANNYGKTILLNTLNAKVSPALVLALIWVESAGKPTAQSNKQAQGLMQLIPATAERFGVANANDPEQNIKGGVTYLNWLMTEFDADPLLALAGYNAGENAVKKHNGVPPYAETRNYVPKVLAAWLVARSLCLTPPVLVSDGCVFRTEG